MLPRLSFPISFTLVGLALLAAPIAIACSDDHDHSESPASCEEIVEACHPLDLGSGPIHECHENAEATGATEASCSAIKAQCLATCVASDAGAVDAKAD